MSAPGRKRTLTDEQVKQIREWKPLRLLARDWGVPERTVRMVREGYQFKKSSP